ncbi:MAG TPA: STAS/SEC14 domain-containing protein [Nostocaceae cyanobacterium]|nr:STAS/SEC14 domain-containing protein [Nostocaceae cyanobacterium]
MSTIKLEIQLSAQELLKAVEQLSQSELEQFVSQVIAIQAQKKAASLPQKEADLLIKINQRTPADIQQRYDELIEKRDDETLTPAEYNELLELTNQIENWDAQRIENLSELASLRGISLVQLMENLGINNQTNV